MSQYLDEVFDNLSIGHSVADDLRKYARAANAMGMTPLAMDLREMSIRLDKSQDAIQKAVAENISRELEELQQSNVNMVAACLAGAELAKTSE